MTMAAAASSAPAPSSLPLVTVNGEQDTVSLSQECSTEISAQPRKKTSKIKKSRRTKFHKLFPHFAKDEVLLNAFSCAFFGDILLQGHLYVSTRMFSFYCRILGQEKRIEIPVKDVLRITREKTAIFIPNAIGILTAEDKYMFGSLLQRNVTYNLMVTVLKANKVELNDRLSLPVQDITAKLALDEVESVSLSLAKDSSDRYDLSVDSDVSSSDNLTEPFCEAEDATFSLNSSEPLMSRSPGTKNKGIPSSSFVYLTLPCLPFVKMLYIANRVLAKLRSLPRTSLMLLVLLIIVVFLLFFTMLLTYKVLALQAQLSTTCTAPNTGSVTESVFELRQALHDSTVNRFHDIMQSAMLVLDEIHLSLQSLQHPFGEETGPSS